MADIDLRRVLVIGGPRCGKTTFANASGLPVQCTDSVMGLGWSEASELVAKEWLTRPGPWIIEGVAAVRALRKWLAANPEGLPYDELVQFWSPFEPLIPGQERMLKGCRTVFDEIAPELERRSECEFCGDAPCTCPKGSCLHCGAEGRLFPSVHDAGLKPQPILCDRCDREERKEDEADERARDLAEDLAVETYLERRRGII